MQDRTSGKETVRRPCKALRTNRANQPMSRRCPLLLMLVCIGWMPTASAQTDETAPDFSQAGMRWHPLTITFEGPEADETGNPNPFRDYRLDVTFEHEATGARLVVPGYFAADGDAAETGATGGTKWRVHFTPNQIGTWTYAASLRNGPDVALSLDPEAGTQATLEGASGTFDVGETDKTGRDFRGKGMLRYDGTRYLCFEGGEVFLKGGADSPESLLAYEDFDGTRSLAAAGEQEEGEAATAPLHRYEPHLNDWNEGSPTWQGGKGKGLIGALNYLASEEMNAFSFLTMNVEGDGKNVWPWTEPDVRDRYDVSKLAQWEKVFTHADSLGLYLHFKTQETENDQLLDGGELGPERKLYYRELIARFGHHLALNWNLGEENDLWDELDDPEQAHVKAHAQYIRDVDPYDHHIVIHSYPNQQGEVYTPLLGEASAVTGASVQTQYDDVHRDTKRWIEASAEAGKPWVVANDEQGNANTGVKPDGPESNRDAIRHHALWGNLMAGGAGVEYYFGYNFAHNDLGAEDWRSRDQVWDDVRHALGFFRDHLPFTEMTSADDLTPDTTDYVFAQPGEVYAVYLPTGGEAKLDLSDGDGAFTVQWFNPREGGALQEGDVMEVEAGSAASLGRPPSGAEEDWVALVRRMDG